MANSEGVGIGGRTRPTIRGVKHLKSSTNTLAVSFPADTPKLVIVNMHSFLILWF